MIRDYFMMSFSSIKSRGTRSWLTMIGIFVGIAAVVALISLGQGLEAGIAEQFNALGTDLLFIQPEGAGLIASGDENPVQLTERDEDEISRSKGVVETASFTYRSGQIDFKDEINFQFITGLPLETVEKQELAMRIAGMKILEGRALKRGDKFKAVAGFDYLTRDKVFSKTLGPGDKVLINGVSFDIVGVMKRIGSAPDDRQLVIPIETAEDLFDIGGSSGSRNRDWIVAQVDPGADPSEIADVVWRDLRNFRNLEEGEEDYQIQTAEDFLGSFNTILGVVQFVLVGIAAISLLVGGIGIMNTMYTAVLERTNEIGIMKAVGARNSDILMIFLFESGMLGLVGGAIGVLLGYLISFSVISIGAQFMPEGFLILFFPWWLIIGGLGFSFIVGAASGVLPAIQASKMNPVDALRYE